MSLKWKKRKDAGEKILNGLRTFFLLKRKIEKEILCHFLSLLKDCLFIGQWDDDIEKLNYPHLNCNRD